MVAGDGIGVTLIAPGRVATPFWDAHGGPPDGGLLTADQIADAIVGRSASRAVLTSTP
jgi:hypothetical protein